MLRSLTVSLLAILGATGMTDAQRVRCVLDFPPSSLAEGAQVDGSGRYVVASWGGPVGAVGSSRIHLWDTVADTLVTLGPEGGFDADTLAISDDGSSVAVVAYWDLGANPDLGSEIFLLATDGSSVVQVTDFVGYLPIVRLALSGDGQVIAFGGPIDPLGTNPNLHGQLFTIRADGTQLLPTTQATSGTLYAISISDDGEKLLFLHDGELGQGGTPAEFQPRLYRIRRNRTELALLASGESFSTTATPRLSGDGETIAYARSGIRIVDWALTQSPTTLIAEGSALRITDDGAWIFYLSGRHIRKIATAGGGATDVVSADFPVELDDLELAGDGSRVLFESRYGDLTDGENPDLSAELLTADGNGLSLQQLTETGPSGFGHEPTISADGTSVAFHVVGLWFAQSGGDPVQLYPAPADDATVAPDGASIVFNRRHPDCQFWRVPHRVELPGGAMTPLFPPADCSGNVEHFDIATDTLEYVMQGLDGSELSVQPLAGGPGRQITFDGGGLYNQPRISDDGVWAVFQEYAPGGGIGVYRVRTDGSGVTDTIAEGLTPDVSDDGNRVVFYSLDDPLGTNPTGDPQVFAYRFDTDQLTQLTISEGKAPILSGDGEWVWMTVGDDQVVREHLDTGMRQRVTGLAPSVNVFGPNRDRWPYSVDRSGDRAVIAAGTAQLTDASCRTGVYLIEFDLPAAFSVTPTALSWDVDPRYDRYDVIRGDLSALGPGTLGDVTCIEDDSVDAASVDPTLPLADAGFFYLRRGNAPAGWGAGSAGLERIPDSGDCP